MSRSLASSLLALVAGLALGALTTWALLDGSAAAPPPSPRPPAGVESTPQFERAVPPALVRAATPDPAASPTRAGSAAERTELTEASGAGAAERAVANLDAEVLSGRIADQRGNGLPGAWIVARPEPGSAPTEGSDPLRIGPAAPPDLLEEQRAAFQRDAALAALERRARSDASGWFRIEGLPSASHWSVRAYLDGWTVQGVTAYSPFLDEVQLTAVPVFEVPVQVVREDGTSPPFAVVHTALRRSGGENPEEDHGQRWTPALPLVRLSRGEHRMFATAGALLPGPLSRRELKSATADLDLVDVAVEPVVLVLRDRPVLTGRLFQDDHLARGNFVVGLQAGGPFDPSAPRRDVTSAFVRGGRFQLLDVTPGESTLYATFWRGQRAIAWTELMVPDGVAEQDLSLPPSGELGLVAVRVVNPRGELVTEEVRLQVAGRTAAGGYLQTLHPVDRRGGELLVDLRDRFGASPEADAKLTLRVHHALYGRQSFPVTPLQREVHCQLIEPLRIELQVTGMESAERAGLRLEVSASRADGLPSPSPVTVAAQGRVVLEPVLPGDYLVQLMATPAEVEGLAGCFQGILGVQQVTWSRSGSSHLVVPSLSDLHVRAGAEDNVTSVMLTRVPHELDHTYGSAKAVIENNVAIFRGLPAGRYQIWGGGVRKQVDVPCGEVLLERD